MAKENLNNFSQEILSQVNADTINGGIYGQEEDYSENAPLTYDIIKEEENEVEINNSFVNDLLDRLELDSYATNAMGFADDYENSIPRFVEEEKVEITEKVLTKEEKKQEKHNAKILKLNRYEKKELNKLYEKYEFADKVSTNAIHVKNMFQQTLTKMAKTDEIVQQAIREEKVENNSTDEKQKSRRLIKAEKAIREMPYYKERYKYWLDYFAKQREEQKKQKAEETKQKEEELRAEEVKQETQNENVVTTKQVSKEVEKVKEKIVYHNKDLQDIAALQQQSNALIEQILDRQDLNNDDKKHLVELVIANGYAKSLIEALKTSKEQLIESRKELSMFDYANFSDYIQDELNNGKKERVIEGVKLQYEQKLLNKAALKVIAKEYFLKDGSAVEIYLDKNKNLQIEERTAEEQEKLNLIKRDLLTGYEATGKIVLVEENYDYFERFLIRSGFKRRENVNGVYFDKKRAPRNKKTVIAETKVTKEKSVDEKLLDEIDAEVYGGRDRVAEELEKDRLKENVNEKDRVNEELAKEQKSAKVDALKTDKEILDEINFELNDNHKVSTKEHQEQMHLEINEENELVLGE